MNKFKEFMSNLVKIEVGGYSLLAVCAVGIATSYINGLTNLLILSGIGWLTLLGLLFKRVK